ncbi:hypothetical protein [Chitinophaga nivalis]|uniref:Leucine-rich repeat domain-containing protein n=1 Tax=Chitinophaga nivalis TaxID=2991709 RepID=A0ABT3IH40_9BACT|nr:hypothetical protein [Chitinophaga nivalis]MCW3467019.1 hypothetical protein [Chitinophaga nivalis]MCW3483290.1 hypothetical protein [Chitinophaga nivalis]
MKMNKIYLLPLLLLMLLFACKKNNQESIDYNVLTEQRINEVAEQPVIKEDDIASLGRLLEKVTDNGTKTRLTVLLEGVKQIKDIIPAIGALRTNPELNFQEAYKQLENKLKLVSDQLPRKAKLQRELEDAKASYNAEEVEFDTTPVPGQQSFIETLTRFLAANYNIKPITGKPNRFSRADIERVDSLVAWPTTLVNIRKFKGVKKLEATIVDEIADLNSLTGLESLKIGYKNELKIEQLRQLKHLVITAGKWGEVLDFTGRYDLLETLVIPRSIAENLTTVLLPNKQHLTKVVFTGRYGGIGDAALPGAKRVVIEAKEVNAFFLTIGSETNREVDEVKLSGFGGATIPEGLNEPYSQFAINGAILPDRSLIKLKKLELSNITPGKFSLANIDLPNAIDLATLAPLRYLSYGAFSINARRATFSDLLHIAQHKETLEAIGINEIDFPGATLDLSDYKKLTQVSLSTQEKHITQPLRKLIISKKTQDAQGTCNDCFVEAWSSVGEVEITVAN